MSASTLTNSPVVTAYRQKTSRSAELAAEAGEVFPSGIVHDSRRTLPYGIYVDKALGARKRILKQTQKQELSGQVGAASANSSRWHG